MTLPPLKKNMGVLLFPGFELLDVFGPLGLIGEIPELTITLVSENQGRVASSAGPESWTTADFQSAEQYDYILVPGGMGTRAECNNPKLLNWIKENSEKAENCLSVCTGSALLAVAGILKGKRATTNKAAYQWATSLCTEAKWQPIARWVQDGSLFTSSGVSAGMDMILAFIAHKLGEETAEKLALSAEYTRHREADIDPFAAYYR